MIVTLLTDFGLDDEFVGVCQTVILGIAPDARVVDLSHAIPRHDVRRGALVLRNSLPWVPPGVHVAVVDPGVGSQRRALALRCGDGRVLVGPDNGLLSPAWERAGGVEEAVDVGDSPFRREPVSATFHARDVFAPVAARLALGRRLDEAGAPVDPAQLTRLELPVPRREGDDLVAHVLTLDSYGNASLDVGHMHSEQLELEAGELLELEVGGGVRRVRVARTFADVAPGEVLLYEDHSGALAIAVNRGDAGRELGLRLDAELRLRRR